MAFLLGYGGSAGCAAFLLRLAPWPGTSRVALSARYQLGVVFMSCGHWDVRDVLALFGTNALIV